MVAATDNSGEFLLFIVAEVDLKFSHTPQLTMPSGFCLDGLLAFIERILQVSFHWPDVLRARDIAGVQTIAQILKTGQTDGFIQQKIAAQVRGGELKRMAANYQPGAVGICKLHLSSYRIKLYGTEFDLGPVQVAVPTARFTEDAEQVIFLNDRLSDDELVTLELKEGIEPALFSFFQWLSPPDLSRPN